MRVRRKAFLLSILATALVWLLPACARQDAIHSWPAEAVLVRLASGGGWGHPPYGWSTAPRLVLYADGLPIFSPYDHSATPP